ncbi:hypothetical protein QO010_000029 [Caulobacter ginsengisoli]|uniref:PDZ domain-containing protein n=1 Tax=Caulobacter ginsengisoli TaxID=400775 RepID=A0ABU0IJU7_9CAUL|nr:aspartyl protease family protein [Caulobacter ginsengisoli]MDQ0462281.1 hypothetical protein [Caulobacter ginsengisoli]
MRPFTLLAGALTALALTAGAACADPLSDLTDRYVAWRGGEAFAKAHGVYETGQARDGEYGGPAQRWQAPGRGREDVAIGAVKLNQAYGPDGGWSVTLSGQVEALSGAELTQLKRRALLTFDDALRGAEGAKVSLQPSETFDGARVAVIRIVFEGPDSYDLLLNPKTGALIAMRLTEDRQTTTVRYGDWRMVEGVRMPFEERQQIENDRRQQRFTFTAIDIDPVIDAQVWAAPAPQRKFAFAGGATATAPLPFEFYLGSRIYIPASVNGVETHVLLDSGAEATVLDKTWAAANGIKPTGSVTAVGTGGRAEAELASGVTIRIGDLELKDLTVVLIDLRGVEKMLGRPLPVILGKEVFNDLAVSLDFQARTIAFQDPAAFTPPAGATAVPIMLVNGLRTVPVSIEGAAPVPMDFDLGNGSPLLVYSAFWKPAGLLTDGRLASKGLSGAVGGLKARDLVTVRTLTFAGVTFEAVPAVLFGDEAKDADGTISLGNIGMPILSRFALTTDYSHDRLWLTPLPDAVGKPFTKDRTGLGLQPPNGKLQFVAPGSPADAAGLKTGDTLTAIDGKPLKDLTTADFQRLRALPAGATLSVTLANGTVKVLTLRDYY